MNDRKKENSRQYMKEKYKSQEKKGTNGKNVYINFEVKEIVSIYI